MKVTIKVEKEVEINFIQVNAGVRYWEDASVNSKEDTNGVLIPFKVDDRWKPIIEINTGIIKDWPIGTTANIHYKICDDGIYQLIDVNGDIVLEKDGYVPGIMCPEENGYGDYIIMNIDVNGSIKDWVPDISDFIDNEEN